MDSNALLSRGATIYPPLDTRLGGGDALPVRSGRVVAEELGGRKLLRYVTAAQLGLFTNGTPYETFVTPTPYAVDDVGRWLVLPSPWRKREHVLILDPALVPFIKGPVWVAAACGIQYVLHDGFPAEAILVPGAPGVRWEVEVR